MHKPELSGEDVSVVGGADSFKAADPEHCDLPLERSTHRLTGEAGTEASKPDESKP